MTQSLLPAEAALLVRPSAFTGGLCLQAALITLLARRHIELGEEGKWRKRRWLRLLPGDGAPLPRHLAILKNTLAAPAHGGRLQAAEAMKALHQAFGNDLRRYVHDVLAPSLVEQGLLSREPRRFLGLIPYTRYARTAAGDARAAPILRVLEQASTIKRLLRNDEEGAFALARAAGVLLLLSPEARSQISKLQAQLAQRGGEGGGSDPATGHEDAQLELGVEFGGLELWTDFGGLLDGICAAGDFTGDGDGGGGDGDGGGGGD